MPNDQSTKRRRPRTALGLPPPSAQGGGQVIRYILDRDLAAFASDAGLALTLSSTRRAEEAAMLNEVIDNFVLWEGIDRRDASELPKATWCSQIAECAAKLQHGLGAAPHWLPQDRMHFSDAMQHLELGTKPGSLR